MAGLRILMVTRGVEPLRPGCGGAELAAEQLARTLARRGHRVTVVSDRDPAECPEAPGLEFAPIDSAAMRLVGRAPRGFVRWLAQHLAGNVSAALAARRLLREEAFDVVHAHGGLTAVLLSRLAGVPVVYTEHDAPPWQCRYRRWWERLLRTRLYRALNVRAFRGVSAVAATFDALAAELTERWGVPAARVASIPNGADLDRFAIALPGAAPFERYCLFVGRLEPRKAPDLLLEAVADAPGVNCVLAGDGPMRSELERRCEELGIAQRVAFLGAVDARAVASLYAGADLLVLPSVSEASPLVVVEAMASGVPVLATRIAGVPTFVDDFRTGFLVRPGDRGELGVALRFLMRDPALRERMSERARQTAHERHPWSAVARRYEHLYRSVLPAPAEPPALVDMPAVADVHPVNDRAHAA